MNLIEYIHVRRHEKSPIGDLIREMLADKDFPWGESSEEMLRYLQFKCLQRFNHDIFLQFAGGYRGSLASRIRDLNQEIKGIDQVTA